MTISWLWVWLLFMLVFVFSPVSYGWGYRGWGPPYPRYMQRRRSERARLGGDDARIDHHAWGWGGDFVWIMLFVWFVWFGASFWRY